MRFAEVFLRLGSALVAWMVIYAHILWLAVLFRLSCGPDGDEMHRLLLGLAPVTVGFALALRATRPLPEIHSILRWLGVPLLLLLPFVGRSTWQVLETVNINASSVCAEAPPTTWQTLWAPVQILVVAIVAAAIIGVWRNVGKAREIEESP